jgi:hypothetical protein
MVFSDAGLYSYDVTAKFRTAGDTMNPAVSDVSILSLK